MSSTQMFKVYNIHNYSIVKVKDAVKITSLPQNETFWVEVKTINYQTKEITGSIQNILQREHTFNLNDIISFKKNNIKEHRLEKDRFDISLLDPIYILRLLNNRNNNLSMDEIEKNINIQYLKTEK